MAVIKIVCSIVLVLFSILLTVLIMMQEGNDNGMSSIMGSSNTGSEFGRKGMGKEAKKVKYTKICAGIVMVLAVALAILTKVSA